MKQIKQKLNSIVAVFLACALLFATTFTAFANDSATVTTKQSTTSANSTTVAQDNSTTKSDENAQKEAQKTLEQQKQELNKKIEDSQTKLKTLESDSKVTADYINALDEKIGYLNEELSILDTQVTQSQTKIDKLEKEIKPLKKEIKDLEKDCKKSQTKTDNLQKKYNKTYDKYCLRLRAMYISGNSSMFEALLLSKDLSQFLSRYEMVRAVAKNDTQLLNEVNDQMEKLTTEQNGLDQKKAKLQKQNNSLLSKQNEIKSQQESLQSNQQQIAQKKVIIAQDRAESDNLLAQYTQQTQEYTEYRNEDQKLMDSVNAEIGDLLSGLKSPEEITTANTSRPNKNGSTSVETNESPLYSNSNAVLNLTYPAPNHYYVSCGFGHYSNGKPHTGVDFSYPMGTKVVAAQKGIVIKVQRLTYSYGYYVMIYHGTDAKGRKVVTLYAHNSSILVSVGQTVKKGQQIACGGSTGNSTGPHCHFELILDGVKVNALNYLSK